MVVPESFPTEIYEFGEFRLDARKQLLFVATRPQPLDVTPKTLELLVVLVRRAGELVEKEQLFSALWPGLVVEENNLNQAVSVLRRVLGEKPGENRYLLTVHGRGYRFVSAVRRVDAPGATALKLAAASSPSRRWRAALLWAIAAASALVTANLIWRQVRDLGWATPLATDATGAARGAIAVLPFDSLNVAGDSAYLAPGIAESIRHRLASVAGLTVIAASSSALFHSRDLDVAAVGRQLKARYLVAGSVQRAGTKLRVTARLLDATSRAQLWSLEFDGGIDEVFALEDQVANGVASRLEPGATLAAQPYARFGTAAYLAYLQGNALLATRRLADTAAAQQSYLRAIRSAHEFAAAFSGLATAYLQESELRSGAFDAESMRRAEPLLDTALKLDHRLGEAYVLRAQLRDARGDEIGAEQDFRTGLALNPSYGLGYQKYAEMLERLNRRDEMRAQLENAVRVDPLAARNYYDLARQYLVRGASELTDRQAESLFLKALQVDPDYYPALTRLSNLYWYTGREADAIQLGERAIEIEPLALWARWFVAEYYLELHDQTAAENVLAQQPKQVLPSQRALFCIYGGQNEQALRLIRGSPAQDDQYSPDSDLYAFAIRDSALSARSWERGRSDMMHLRPGDLSPESDPVRIALLAQLSSALGKSAEAKHYAGSVLALTQHDPPHWNFYSRAIALLVLEQRDQAIAELESGAAHRIGSRWWYVLEREAAFLTLRNEPKFLRLVSDETKHLRSERDKVEEMRTRGELPHRDAARAESLRCN